MFPWPTFLTYAVITAATLIDIGVTTYRAVRYSESAL